MRVQYTGMCVCVSQCRIIEISAGAIFVVNKIRRVAMPTAYVHFTGTSESRPRTFNAVQAYGNTRKTRNPTKTTIYRKNHYVSSGYRRVNRGSDLSSRF